jgi:hypothetical protein
MPYKLTNRKKDQILEAGLYPDGMNEVIFISELEWVLENSLLRQPQNNTQPLAEFKEHLLKVINNTNDLQRLLEDDKSQYVRENSSMAIAEHFHKTEESLRWNGNELTEVLAIIARQAEYMHKNITHDYGARNEDKAMSDLLDFWQVFLKQSIRPITTKGKFVKLLSIILSKDTDSMIKKLRRFLKRNPAAENKDIL